MRFFLSEGIKFEKFGIFRRNFQDPEVADSTRAEQQKKLPALGQKI